MIVRDGGQNLTPLLTGAAPWVDEMVVGDTGSTDGSPAVAAGLGARVIPVPWRDDFAAARNAVLQQCRGAWVLVLDADEQLAAGDWQALRTWVETAGTTHRHQAGVMATRNYQPSPYNRRGWIRVPDPDPHALAGGAPAEGFVVTAKVRLFPNLPQIHFRGALHETVEASLRDSHVATVDLPWPVHHFGYLTPDPDKVRRYLHLAHLKTTSQPHDAQAWAELADCAIALGEYRQALVAIDRSLALDPGHPARHLTAGWLLYERGEPERADVHLATVTGYPGIDDHQLAEACHLRAQIAMQRERPHAAAPLLGVALRLFPDNGHYQNTLGSLNLMSGRTADARQALERAAGLLPGAAAPRLNLALLLHHVGDDDEAAAWLQAAADCEPDHPRLARVRDEITPAPLVGMRG